MAEFVSDSTKMDAVDILKTYAAFIREDVRAADFERHPYLPHIEQTIEDLRAAPPAMDREAAREVLAKAAERAGCVEVPKAIRAGEVALINSDIALDALSTLSADAIRQGEGLRGLRALSDRATPGPWSWEQCGEKEDVPVVGIAFPGDDGDCKAPYEGEFRDSDANRMTIAFDWQSCDGHSPSANAAFAVAAVNFVRKLFSDGGEGE